MARFTQSTIVLAAALLSAGCTYQRTVSGISTDYNRAMATTRDEQLLINILRASGREPLMFSAVGEVTGTAQDKAGLEIATEGLLSSVKNVINPTLSLEGSTGPTVKVTPLSSKEFTEGILQPIKPSTLNYFMSQGWDAEFLLPLVISGYRCGGEEANLNSKHAGMVAQWGAGFSMNQTSPKPALKDLELTVSDDEALRLMREGAPNGYTVASVTDIPSDPRLSKVVLTAPALGDVAVTVSDSQALEMMRSGVAGGYKVKAVLQGSAPRVSRVVLTVPTEKGWEATFGAAGPTCPPPEDIRRVGSSDDAAHVSSAGTTGRSGGPKTFAVTVESGDSAAPASEGGKPSLQFRSVEGILYYLGSAFRPCLLRREDVCAITYDKEIDARERQCLEEAGVPAIGRTFPRTLFRVHSRGVPPATSAIQTRYNGNRYWVNRLDRCDMDRTLKTLSFLSQLIALQTNASDLVVTPSVIAIGGR